MAQARLKPPELNAFRYGKLTGAEFAPSTRFDHPDIKLSGNWETEGEGHWYANWKAVTALAQAGLLRQMPGDGRQFQAITGVRFCIYRQSAGGDSMAHDWFAITYDTQGQATTLEAFADPVEPQGAAAPPPPDQAAGGPPPPQTAQAAGGPPPPQPLPGTSAPPGSADGAMAAHHRNMLVKIDARYGLSLVVAAYQQVRLFGVPVTGLDPQGLQAGAATVMIQLSRDGYDLDKDLRPSYLRRLQNLEHSLFPDDCPAPLPPKTKERAAEDKMQAPPDPVSTVPGAEYSEVPEALSDSDEDLPF